MPTRTKAVPSTVDTFEMLLIATRTLIVNTAPFSWGGGCDHRRAISCEPNEDVSGATLAKSSASRRSVSQSIPPDRFYDANKAGCGLNRDLSEFAQANDLDQGFDELTQQRLDSCCVRCEDCEVDIERPVESEKMGPDYVECSGATLSDTQKQCMRKCPFGTHESNQTCVRCQECFVGESLSIR